MEPLGKQFTSSNAVVNGVNLHYVRGGAGPAIILIHGFPQDWFEYRAIMPRLAERFTVVAVDLRGIGESEIPSGGYDASNMAEDLKQLCSEVQLEQVYWVGHDIGGQVVYAFIRRYPRLTRGALIIDSPIPGLGGWDEIQKDASMWHMHFMQVLGLAEKLVAGHEADYLDYFFSFSKFSADEKEHYVKAYAGPERMHAAFEMYRALPANAEFNAAQKTPLAVPLFLAAGEHSPFAKRLATIAAGLRANGCTQVCTGLIPNSVHYILEENPEAVAKVIEQNAAVD